MTAGDAEAVIEIEAHGQDAVVGAGQARVQLIQFKHSTAQHQVSPSELAKILTTFEQSEASLNPAPGTVDWVLRTNRVFSTTTKALVAGNPPGGKKNQAGREAAKTVKRLGNKLKLETYEFTDFESELRARARLLGVDDIAGATNGLLGLLYTATGQPRGHRQLRINDLDTALAGFSGALRLDAGPAHRV